jgi:hypothetical protein
MLPQGNKPPDFGVALNALDGLVTSLRDQYVYDHTTGQSDALSAENVAGQLAWLAPESLPLRAAGSKALPKVVELFGKLFGGGATKAGEAATTELVHQSFAHVAEDGFFMGFRRAETLKPGAVIDRFGSEGGRYFSPEGTPFPQRGLPPSAARAAYSKYEVLRDLPAEGGLVDPVFGPGLGIQYKSALSARQLVRQGYLRRLP